MDSTFTRAFIGFVTLTLGLALMAWVALWSLDQYVGGASWWAALLIVLVALCVEVSIYATTLHDPIRDWIKEPALRAERERDAATTDRRVTDAIREHERKFHPDQPWKD